MTYVNSESEVIVEKRDGLGRIVLNRPKAINALNHAMVRQIAAALAEWSGDDEVRAVVITGAGERGLCAGGDIVSIYHDAKDGGTGSREFWREEYILNAAIAGYGKPYVAIMDGIVMGGGVGVSAHGSVRIVTERSMIGMPETGIGFVPDVGGTYLLARTPGELGTHIALTTARLSAGDAIACGFADHFIPSEKIEQFLDALSTASVQEALAQFTEPAPASELLAPAGLDRRRVLGEQCRRHRRPAARQWGARGGEGGRAGAREVADRVRGHPDIAAPRTAGRQPRGSTQ